MALPFKLGASYTIGSYILPGEPIINIANRLDRKIDLKVATCDKIVEGVKKKEFELGLIESPIFDADFEYIEWMEDELVICSKTELSTSLDKEKLGRCKLLCRCPDSPTRRFIGQYLEKEGLSYDTFNSLSVIDNTTVAIQGLKWSKKNKELPTVAIVSKLVIEEEFKKDDLHIARINNHPLYRKFYLLYNKSEGKPPHLEEIIQYLKAWR